MYKLKVRKAIAIGFYDKKGAVFDDEEVATRAAINHGGTLRIVRVEDNRIIKEIIVRCPDCGHEKSECHRCEQAVFCFCHQSVRLCDPCYEIVRNLPPEPDPDEELWK